MSQVDDEGRAPPLVSFPGDPPATLARAGGKGRALMELAAAGLPVPPGLIVTSEFFAPWFAALRASPGWSALVGAAPERWDEPCAALKRRAASLELDPAQRAAVDALRERAAALGITLAAVRSSSPDEDLAGASFAGGYETCLGVPVREPGALERALRRCFASSLDARVFHYKRARGLEVFAPSIAAVVQRQLASEVAGVGFSLNPVTNDLDELVLDASWGLGEAVVAGQVTPDHFVIDKLTGAVIERQLGAKQVAIELAPSGGTVTRAAAPDERERPALTQAQLEALRGLMGQVEALYQRPVDIEFAYEEGALHLLQARPITTHVPVPPELLTAPGERRRLYADMSLSKGLTINAPLSRLGLDWMKESFYGLIESFIGPVNRDLPPEHALLLFAGGRMYTNLSTQLWLQSPKAMAAGARGTDVLMAELFANIDRARYRATRRPSWFTLRALLVIPRALWRLRAFFWNTLRCFLAPARAHRRYLETLAAIERDAEILARECKSFDEFKRRYLGALASGLFSVLMPALLVGLAGFDRLIPRRRPDAEALRAAMSRGYPGNVVVGMGVALHQLARTLGRAALDDPEALAVAVSRRALPPEAMRAWDDFMASYGWRGPGEMDLGRPRYADDPRLVIQQMAGMSLDDPAADPAAIHARNQAARREAFERLLADAGWFRRRRLRRRWRTTELFSGTRDTPKDVNVMFGYSLRAMALRRGQALVERGRLDAAAQVFDLTFDELEAAARDPELDLRALRREATRFHEQLRRQVREFPPVIDSRGRILRLPPRDEAPGELRGMAVSYGRAVGPVKVLRDASSKRVEPGDVLVAYTTDPGWTPLFANASAVLLEVGGVLQHGAVVARELGKPCVVGIERLMSRLQDGQRVEVDGTSGVVRLLDPDAAEAGD